MTSTFAHPYVTQVVALWLSFIPVLGVMALMTAAQLRGDRSGGRARIQVRVPVSTDSCL